MYIAWLVFEDEDDKHPTLWTEQPPSHYSRVTRIAWSELRDNELLQF